MPRRGKREDLQWFRDAARRRAETLDEMLRGSLVTRVRRGSTCSRGLQPSVEGVRDGEGLGWAEGSSCRRAGGLVSPFWSLVPQGFSDSHSVSGTQCSLWAVIG